MKQYIFIWNIENISHSWHKKGERIESPSFLADTLEKIFWRLSLYPRGDLFDDWLSLYLHKVDVCSRDFLVGFELSCVSANHLTLMSYAFEQMKFPSARNQGVSKFLERQEVFVSKKDLYVPQDTLKLRCRLWIREEGVNVIRQCFGCTRLEIESFTSVKVMNPRINKHTKVSIISNHLKRLLISIDVHQQNDGLQITLHPTIDNNINFYTFKFLAVGRNRGPYEFVTSWFVRPYRTVWRSPFLIVEKFFAVNNILKITCELVYPTGREIKSIEKVNPCLFKFPQFCLNCILPCIPSFKMSDCPAIYKSLWNLYKKQILCDVELKTPTTSFWVHKIVLCAPSSVFLAMFTHEMKESLTNCVEIEDLEADTLEKLLKFIYSDSFEETQWDAVMKLYYSADKYQIERLKHLCCSYFMSNINDLNVSELLKLADRYNDFDLRWNVEDYIYKHRVRIFESSTWFQFVVKQTKLALGTFIRVYEKAVDSVLDKEKRRKEKEVEERMFTSYANAVVGWKPAYYSQIGSDIDVQTSTTTFPVHKVILCAGSSMLKKMFASGKLTESLKMEDLEDDTVSRLLLFLYTDSLGDINLENASKLYHAAIAYQIERLRIYCSCFFLKNLNACNLLHLAHVHQDVRLQSLMDGRANLPEWFEDKRPKCFGLNVLKLIFPKETRPGHRKN